MDKIALWAGACQAQNPKKTFSYVWREHKALVLVNQPHRKQGSRIIAMIG
jgi:hypothetical protein